MTPDNVVLDNSNEVTENLIEKISLDEDNITMIVEVIKAGLRALPEHYVSGFEDYLLSLEDRVQTEVFDDFWRMCIIHYVNKCFHPLESVHNSLVEFLNEEGWTFNVQFNSNARTCPLLVNFHNLTLEEASIVRYVSGTTWSLVTQDDAPESDDADEA